MTPGNGADPVEAAIGAVEKPAVQMRQVQLTIACSGRATDSELLEVAGWMLTQLRGALRTAEAAPRIAIAHSLPRGRLP